MVPSALPAFSAPMRVRLVPSCWASVLSTAAWAVPRVASSALARRVLAIFMVCSCWRPGWSQGGLEGQDHEATVAEQRVGATVRRDHVQRVGGGVAEVVHVLEVETVLRPQV